MGALPKDDVPLVRPAGVDELLSEVRLAALPSHWPVGGPKEGVPHPCVIRAHHRLSATSPVILQDPLLAMAPHHSSPLALNLATIERSASMHWMERPLPRLDMMPHPSAIS